MAKETKKETEPVTASYETACGVMMRLGVNEIWHTTDGQWFTAKDKAEDHAGKTQTIIQYFKLKKF